MKPIRLSTWTFKVNKGKSNERTVVAEGIVVAADHPDDVRNDLFYIARALRRKYGKTRYFPNFCQTHKVHKVELHESIGQTSQ